MGLTERRMQGRAVIVTGSGSGIGREIAIAFAGAGASVVVVDIDGEGVTETVRLCVEKVREYSDVANGGQIGEKMLGLQRDIGSSEAIGAVVEACVAKFGRLDCVVNNAASQAIADLENITEAHWDSVMAINVRAAMLFVQHALPYLTAQPGGSIVNIASLVAEMPIPGRIAYNTSKAALLGLTRSLAVELGLRGIRVNAISPGHIMSWGEAVWRQDNSVEEQRVMESSYALGRCGRPEEVASAAVFLASSDASFITGHNLLVDGGMSILCPETSVHRAARLE